MGLQEEMVFRDPVDGEIYPVKQLPDDESKWKLEEGIYYQKGDFVYPFVGHLASLKYLKTELSGCVAYINGKMTLQEWKTDEEKIRHSIRYIVEKSRIDELERKFIMRDYAGIIADYMDAYHSGNNLASKIRRRARNTGKYYRPELSEDDFPLDRITKLMVQSMRIVSSEQRNNMDKEYGFDNLVSTLNGGTDHMSIMKFLDWTYLLNWKWEMTLFNINNELEYPLSHSITVTDHDDSWKDIEEPESKDVFKVPLVRSPKNKEFNPDKPFQYEDPFKRLIKLALDDKNVPTSYYRNKGTTPHLINNMKSALKSGQKMTSRYFHIWCELLDMGFMFTVTNEMGTYYKITGMDIDRIETNYVEPEDKGDDIDDDGADE